MNWLRVVLVLWINIFLENVNVICLPRVHKQLSTEELDSKVSVCSGSNWNLEVLVFVEAEKNPWSKDENQQQTQPT